MLRTIRAHVKYLQKAILPNAFYKIALLAKARLFKHNQSHITPPNTTAYNRALRQGSYSFRPRHIPDSSRRSESTALSGSLELAMRNLVTKFAISPKDPGRIIKHLRLGATNGLKPTVNMQTLGDDLSAKLYALGNAENIIAIQVADFT